MAPLTLRERAAAPAAGWMLPVRRAPGVLGSLDVLGEVHGAEGVALWQALRDAELWAGAAPEHRGRLWRPATAPAEAGGRWNLHLQRLAAACAEGPAARARACLEIARAAAAHGCRATALAFAEVAARTVPADSQAALEAGRLAREAGEPRRAEAWVRRAAALARRALDRSTYGLACCAWAGLLRERAETAAAGERYLLAARMARRYGLWRVKPLAAWGLCALAAAEGRTAEATLQGRRALRAFGRRDPRLPHLAHDLAKAWAAAGCPGAALRVLRPAIARLRTPAERAPLLATMAVLAGAAVPAEPAPREVDTLSVLLAETLSLRDDEW